MRADGEIGEKFLLTKISAYTVIAYVDMDVCKVVIPSILTQI